MDNNMQNGLPPGYFGAKQELVTDIPSPPPVHTSQHHQMNGDVGGGHHHSENRYSDINVLLDQES